MKRNTPIRSGSRICCTVPGSSGPAYAGTVPALANGYAAGFAPLVNLNAVFFGSFVVTAPGNVTFNVYSADGFIFGVSGGATRVSGANTNPPLSGLTPCKNYPVMGAYNQPGAPSPTAIVVNFPAAGVYLYEVDYAEGGGPLVLTMTVGGAAVAPAGALTLTPIAVTPQSSGQSQTFTLTATDAGGTAVANLPVTLTITGVNPQQLNATTDASGHATFTYTGTHGGGTDTLQAQGTISGMLAYSNVVSVPWSGGANQAPVSNAGPPVITTFPNPVTLNGSATDDGLPTGSALAYTWTTVSGPGTVTFGTPNAAVTTASFSVVGTYTLQLSVSDSQLTGTSTTTVNPAGSGPTLTLTPPAAGPRVTGSSQQLTATLKDATGAAVAGATVQFAVTGVNPANGSAVTDTAGVALFNYTGTATGTDSARSSSSLAGSTIQSNISTVSWVVPSQTISSTTITGRFFVSTGSGVINILPGQQPLFTQIFPTINFNPPAGTIPGNTSNVGVGNRPMVDITTDLNGNYTGGIIAQGNGYQAGVGVLDYFNAVFTGAFTVAAAGDVTFNFYSDDGFMLGVGGGATRVSGVNYNLPASGVTPFQSYPIMGGLNTATSPVANTLVVHFPSAGTYPYELDYSECCGGPLVLQMTAAGVTGDVGVPPSGSLTISPNTVTTQTIGTPQTFTLQANDASGAALSNLTVAITVSGVNPRQLQATTDATGHATFTYTGTVAGGNDIVQANATITGMAAYSNMVTVPWNTGTNQAPVVSGGSALTVTLPQTAVISGSVIDDGLPAGSTLAISWSTVSGPGTVTFSNPNQPVTAAAFSPAGVYVLRLTASDSQYTATSDVTVTANSGAAVSQGWISGVTDHGTISGIVPISVVAGVTLQSGTLSYWPVSNQSAVNMLNSNTQGSGTLGTLDTTLLANGSYWIQLDATNTSSVHQNNIAMITVAGDYKPGRVTASVTDLVVPAAGLPISITRVYDSLDRNKSGDFGYGWSLTTAVKLDVNPANDVTLTINNQRRTFYFAPQPNGIFTFFYAPKYTAEPGFYGSLTTTGDNCFGVLIRVGNLYQCAFGVLGPYQPNAYVYTDPYGRVYTVGTDGNLQSLADLNGNTLTVTPNGIASSAGGLTVPFVRDAQGRITKITDPLQHDYLYHYNASGELDSVTLPSISTAIAYTYNTGHFLHGGTDARSNPLPTTIYDTAGRLQSVTDAAGKTTSYAYNTATRTTTITYPPDAMNNVGTATMIYDAYGKMTSQTDPLNHPTTNLYNADHTLQSTTDALSHTTSYSYDSNGNQNSVTYPHTATSVNTTSSTTYNQYGLPTTHTDEMGKIQTFIYDSNFNLSKVTDQLDGSTSTLASSNFNANGTLQSIARGYDLTVQPNKATRYLYDQYGNRTARIDPLGRQATYTYDNLGRLLTTTPPLPTPTTPVASVTTTNQYDALGRLMQITAPMGKVTTYTYDNNGNRLTETVNGHTTSYQYDAMNRVILITYPTTPQTTMSYTYDFRGNVIDMTDQSSHITRNEYDLAGRLAAVTVAYGTVDASRRMIGYDDANRKITETDANNDTTTYNYDEANRLTNVLNAKNQTTSYVYDDAGNRISMTDPNQHTTQYQYDVRHRLKKTTYHDTTFTAQTYDGAGQLASVTDQASKMVNYNYDDAQQLVSVMQANHPDPAHNTTVYGYDPHGNLTTITDANSHTTITLFDLLDRQSSRTLPTGGSAATSTYDVAGNQLTFTDFLGKMTTYTYDGVNRLTSKTPDASLGEPAVSFTYTGTGKRASMIDASGTITYTYDNQDRLKTKVAPQGTLTYTYDAVGNVASINSSNANGASVNYTWDELNRLASVIDNRLQFGQNTTTYTYDPASNLATVTYPNGVQSSFTYDPLNRLLTLPITKNSTIASYTYVLGPAGNRRSMTELSGRSVIYTYDGIYRLTNETISSDPAGKNGSVGYGLDPVGNRLSQTSTLAGIATGSYTYDGNDRLSTESYDANGNTTISGARTFRYDFENRLKDMNSGQVQMVYDVDGNRVSETTGAGTTKYLIDNLNPTKLPQVLDEIVNGSVTRTYAYGPQRISENQLINGTWTPSFYGYDGHGNVRFLTNSAGTITDTYQFDAFGAQIATTGTTPNPYLYSGERFDSNLTLYQLRARYYNMLTGRFETMDPDREVCCVLRRQETSSIRPRCTSMCIQQTIQLTESIRVGEVSLKTMQELFSLI